MEQNDERDRYESEAVDFRDELTGGSPPREVRQDRLCSRHLVEAAIGETRCTRTTRADSQRPVIIERRAGVVRRRGAGPGRAGRVLGRPTRGPPPPSCEA